MLVTQTLCMMMFVPSNACQRNTPNITAKQPWQKIVLAEFQTIPGGSRWFGHTKTGAAHPCYAMAAVSVSACSDRSNTGPWALRLGGSSTAGGGWGEYSNPKLRCRRVRPIHYNHLKYTCELCFCLLWGVHSAVGCSRYTQLFG